MGGGVGGHDGEVLGGVPVGEVQRLLHGLGDEDAAFVGEGAPGDVPPGSVLQQIDEGALRLVGDPSRRAHQNTRCVGVVRGLGQHLVCGEAGIAGFVEEDEDLRGAGRRVDEHRARHLPLGLGDPTVARTDDGVHGGHRLGTVGQGCDGAGSAQGVQPVGPGDGAGGQDRGGRTAVGTRRRTHHHVVDPRGLGGDDAHEHGARVGGGPSRRIDSDALQGSPGAGDAHARFDLHHDVLGHLGGVEGPDVLRRPFQSPADR